MERFRRCGETAGLIILFNVCYEYEEETSEKKHDVNDLGMDDNQLNIHNRQYLMTTNQ